MHHGAALYTSLGLLISLSAIWQPPATTCQTIMDKYTFSLLTGGYQGVTDWSKEDRRDHMFIVITQV